MNKSGQARIASVAGAARSDVTGADQDAGADQDGSGARGDLRRHRASAIKRPLLVSVSAVERLRMWLLRQAWFHSVLLPKLPRRLRWMLRTIYLVPTDLADRLLGRRDAGLPPKAQRYTGGVHDFAGSARFLVEALSDVAGVKPSSRILDVGCGIGRLAIAMPDFLDADGGYEGLDIVPKGIEWCQQNIVGPHGNIRFTLADVYNKEYNPKGILQPADYQFPYADETFDVAVLVSVFTHMLPVDVDRYVGEIARVLKKDGRIFATYFIITPESLRLMDSKSASAIFKYDLGSHWIQSKKVPELGVAYDERWLRGIYSKHGLSDPPDIYFGRWSGGAGYWPPDSGLGGQDVVVATKL